MILTKLAQAVINPNQPIPTDNPVVTGLNIFGLFSGLGTADLRLVIANLIRLALGFIGIIMMIMIIWGGFLWLTAGGNDDQTAKAKGTLVNAIIGLVIILAANSIVMYLISALTVSTGAPLL